MNKSRFSRYLAILLSLFILLTSSTGFCLSNDNATSSASTQKTFTSQFSQRFPEEDPTSRTLARSRRVFKGYKGQGNMIIESYGATSVKIYVNGNKISIPAEKLKNKTPIEIDISKYTRNGDNTLKVLSVKPEGTYLNVSIEYPTLSYGKPEDVGFNSDILRDIDKYINNEIKEGFPSAVLLVMKDGKIIKNTAYGYKKKYDQGTIIDAPEKTTIDTIYDLASNTKMYATNIALYKLVSEGKIDLQEYVHTYIPDFKQNGKDKIKVLNLLTHTSGFAPSVKFYKKDNDLGEEFFSQDKEKTCKLMCELPLINEVGKVTKYSDLDFMVLGYIIEEVTGQPLDIYIEENIYSKLGLKNTMFNPTKKGLQEKQFAATEIFGNTRAGSVDFENIRKHTLQGEVHDEKAYYSMDGVSGHAGLFSTTKDLAVLCQLILNKGGYGDVKIFDANVGDQFAKPSYNSNVYGVGWNRAANMNRIWMFGPYASNLAIGHTGWTGTLTVIDPRHDLAIVLLTNKKHSQIEDGKFLGDGFQTGKYGSIVSMIYEALLENNK
ncbi:penicillin binding protein PBP4B [Clostridiaceae bacterium M8S5]|nr:penicillin binding protein PBP4B [Clostridiaceae bacterium M8S5]